MAIGLDDHTTGTRPPVVRAAGFGQTVVGMVIDKEVRPRRDNKSGAPILKADGRPSHEEVLTVMIMGGSTGIISGGDFGDDRTPEAGECCRLIVKGRDYGALIDARKKGTKGATNVGDVITAAATAATIWRGKGDIAKAGTTDPDDVSKARAKGLSVSWDTVITYRAATPDEAALVAKAEGLHHQLRERISLDQAASSGGGGDFDEEDPF